MSTTVMPRTQTEQLRLPMRDGDRPGGRADARREATGRGGNGCDVHPSCLRRALPRCRYEGPGGLRARLNKTRDAQIVGQRASGVPVSELATRFGVSRRTVFRVLGNKSRQPIPIRKQDAAPTNGQTRREAHCA